MADDVKKVKIDIRAETTKATKEIKSLNRQIDSLEKQQTKTNRSMKKNTATMNKMGASFRTLGEHLSRLVVIYGSFQAMMSTLRVIGDFEQAIVTLGAISGATGEELQKLEEKAMKLGETTVFTASQVANAMTEMAKAGFTAQEQLDGISSVLNLSIVGMVDIAEATRISTIAMKSFDLEAKDLPRVIDVLSQSINNSAQNIKQLGLGLSKVGSIAEQQHMSLEETSAILGVLADAGRRGAEGGTQFKIAMLRMGSNPESAKFLAELNELFADLDVSMYNSSGQIKPFIERLTVLNKAFKRLSEEQANQFKTRIFGTEAIASGNIMLENIDKIVIKTALMRNSFGVADQQAIKMMDTLKGSHRELMSALEGLQIKIGKNLSPALINIIDDSTEFIRALDAKDIDDFSKSLASLIEFLGDMTAAIKGLITAAIKLGNTISNSVGGISAEFVILVAIIYRLRDALLKLSASHPALMVLAVAVGYVGTKMLELNRILGAYEDRAKSFIDVNEKFTKTVEDSVVAIKSLNQNDLRKSNKQLLSDIKRMDNLVANYTKRINELEKKKDNNTIFGISDVEQTELDGLKESVGVLNSLMKDAVFFREKVIEAGREAVRQANLERNANNQLTVSAIRLTEEELKSINVKIRAMTNRKRALENTLNSMLKKETTYYAQLNKLEADIHKTRRDFANKRESLKANFENDIATIRASSLNDLQIYNDAQLRADTYLAKSKNALQKGNLVMAKEYMSIYNSLITKNATSEIKLGEQVVRTKRQLNDELIRDKQASHKIELQILAEEEKRAIASINSKIALKKTEIAMNRLQIDLQIKAIELQAKMIARMTGAKLSGFDEDLRKAKKELVGFDKELNKIVEQQRKLEIDAILNKSEFEKNASNLTIEPNVEVEKKEIDQVQDDIEKTRVVMTITDIRTGEVETKINGIRVDAEKPIKGSMIVDTDKATSAITIVQKKATKPTSNVHTTKPNTIAATRAISALKRNTSSTHTVYVRKVEKHATGGFIQRQGFLGGYGGGDRIKALLENGEFIVRKEAVRSLGVDKLRQINQGIIPKYQTGGLVGTSNNSNNRVVELNLNIGGNTFTTSTDEQTADAIASYLQSREF